MFWNSLFYGPQAVILYIWLAYCKIWTTDSRTALINSINYTACAAGQVQNGDGIQCDSDSSDAYEGEEPEVIELCDVEPSEKEKWVNDRWVSEF